MILVNGLIVRPTVFPDNTSSVRLSPIRGEHITIPGSGVLDSGYYIEWKYDNDQECMLMWHLAHHIRENDLYAMIVLYMPYIPNARMDRVKNRDEIFTLKWFAEFINAMAFDKVVVCDPHSNVATALIDRVEVVDAIHFVGRVITELDNERNMNVLLCYPDEGAAKRYSEQISGEYVFCIKHRDWRTGKIERLELTNQDKVAGRNVLIVDDICSRGGTFTHTARALKEAGAKEAFLYVTHCEKTIFNGSVLTDGLISHVYTTDSIFRGESDKITVFKE